MIAVLFSFFSLVGMDDTDLGGLFPSDFQRGDPDFSLHHAVAAGNVLAVKDLVEKNIFDINGWGDCGETCLHKASFIKDPMQRSAIVRILLQGKADPNTFDSYNQQTCLYSFVVKNQPYEVDFLLAHKADIGEQDYQGDTIFHAMVKNNDIFSNKSKEVMETCFRTPFLRLKTFFLCKKNIEHRFKLKIPRPIAYIIACLIDSKSKLFFNSEFNNSLAKKNEHGQTAYDIIFKKSTDPLILEKYNSIQWLVDFFKPIEQKK